MSLLPHIAGFHRFLIIQRTPLVAMRGVHNPGTCTFHISRQRLPKASTHQFQALPVPIGSSVMHSVVALLVLDGWVGIVLEKEL